MTDIPYYIVVNKPNKQHKLEQKFVHAVGKDLDDIQNKIVYILQEEFQTFQNIPPDYENFVSKCWYLHYSADVQPFEYKLFHQGKWVDPWTPEDLYDNVFEILHKLELLGAYVTESNKDDEEFDEKDEAEED